jgi:hypothetical protein
MAVLLTLLPYHRRASVREPRAAQAGVGQFELSEFVINSDEVFGTHRDVFRRVFERVVEACIAAGLVGGEAFAVDASLIQADANKQRSIAGQDWRRDRDPQRSSRAVKEYLATLDDTAWGAASDVVPKFVSTSQQLRRQNGLHARSQKHSRGMKRRAT